jgi:hypothetical protein
MEVALGMDDAGNGPTVVLLPALSSISTREEMRPLFDRLAPNFRVVTVDWPGFGNQARPQIDWTPIARFPNYPTANRLARRLCPSCIGSRDHRHRLRYDCVGRFSRNGRAAWTPPPDLESGAALSSAAHTRIWTSLHTRRPRVIERGKMICRKTARFRVKHERARQGRPFSRFLSVYSQRGSSSRNVARWRL